MTVIIPDTSNYKLYRVPSTKIIRHADAVPKNAISSTEKCANTRRIEHSNAVIESESYQQEQLTLVCMNAFPGTPV